MSMMQEFKSFISRGNVMDLAVGVIIGAAFAKIVDSLVQDIIMPIVGKLVGGLDFSNYYLPLKPGEMKIVEWRGKPVWLLKRTPEMMAELAKLEDKLADPVSEKSYTMELPSYCDKHTRSRPEHKDILIAVGICPHLGCSPSSKFQAGAQPSLPDDWAGGFLCPCHGSTFDLAGRVFKNKPSPTNLDVPRHMYLSDTKIIIGKDEKGEA